MRRTGLILLIAAALATPFFLGTGFAQGWGGGMHGAGMMHGNQTSAGHMGAGHMMSGTWGQHMQNVPEQYRLSDEQQAKVDRIRESYQDQVTPLIEQLRETRQAYAAEFNSEEFNAQKVKQLRDKASQIQDQISERRIATQKQVNKILTEDQLAYYSNHHGLLMGMNWDNMHANYGHGYCWDFTSADAN